MALNEYRCGVFGKKVLARHATILRALQSGEESAANLARICECPAASVRRSIQELRGLGHNVCHAAHDEQLYRLGSPLACWYGPGSPVTL